MPPSSPKLCPRPIRSPRTTGGPGASGWPRRCCTSICSRTPGRHRITSGSDGVWPISGYAPAHALEPAPLSHGSCCAPRWSTGFVPLGPVEQGQGRKIAPRHSALAAPPKETGHGFGVCIGSAQCTAVYPAAAGGRNEAYIRPSRVGPRNVRRPDMYTETDVRSTAAGGLSPGSDAPSMAFLVLANNTCRNVLRHLPTPADPCRKFFLPRVGAARDA